ncbi:MULTISPECIES: hypothetical protein [Calothrix]|uniref:Uncharacterized protein n=2 Tax=Calothrix TaxID=1186 RepID=A0ABR8AKV4_9CYAN|nr:MULTISPECIES: hypothetical protein [Calothrix]MBD2200160.1 hypothetical protein [Calothrix parietina FACHB-288]MBD2229130.1 hypothetical protein [Calothrix anomala FACHB-343]
MESNFDILMSFYGGEEGFEKALIPDPNSELLKSQKQDLDASIALAKQIAMKERDRKRLEGSKKGALVSTQKRMEKSANGKK